jgi:hypothetical protein
MDILVGVGQIVIGATIVYVAWQQHELLKRQKSVDQRALSYSPAPRPSKQVPVIFD